MATFNEFLEMTYWGNSGRAYLTALAIFIGLFIILKFFDKYIIIFLKKKALKTKIKWDDIFIDFVNAIHWQFYAYLSLFIASRFLVIPETANKVMLVLLWVFVAFYGAQGLSRVVDFFTNEQIEKRRESDNFQNTSMIKVFGNLFKAAIWVLAVMMILTNLGIEITPLIASLGIGGVAIAIALQSVLSDLFSAFAIYFDKPFKEGDFIIIGNDLGTGQ